MSFYVLDQANVKWLTCSPSPKGICDILLCILFDSCSDGKHIHTRYSVEKQTIESIASKSQLLFFECLFWATDSSFTKFKQKMNKLFKI